MSRPFVKVTISSKQKVEKINKFIDTHCFFKFLIEYIIYSNIHCRLYYYSCSFYVIFYIYLYLYVICFMSYLGSEVNYLLTNCNLVLSFSDTERNYQGNSFQR